jgi:hypothetical protein
VEFFILIRCESKKRCPPATGTSTEISSVRGVAIIAKVHHSLAVDEKPLI